MFNSSGNASSGFWIPDLTNVQLLEVLVTRFGFWGSNYLQRKKKVERKNKLKLSQMSCSSSVL